MSSINMHQKNNNSLRQALKQEPLVEKAPETIHKDCIKHGWLLKQGNAVIKDWKKRYFLLFPESLVYYASIPDFKTQNQIPKGKINLKECTIKISAEKKKNALDIIIPNRTYIVVARDSQEMIDWLNTVSEQILTLQEKKGPLVDNILSSGKNSWKQGQSQSKTNTPAHTTRITDKLNLNFSPVSPRMNTNNKSPEPEPSSANSSSKGTPISPNLSVNVKSPLTRFHGGENKHRRTGSTQLSDDYHPQPDIIQTVIQRLESKRDLPYSFLEPPSKPASHLDFDSKKPSTETLKKVADFKEAYGEQFKAWNLYVEQRLQRYQELVEEYQDVPTEEKIPIFKQHWTEESRWLRERRVKPKVKDYQPIIRLGKGGFGSVFLVRHTNGKGVFAMKKMSKSTIEARNKIAHIMTERDILSRGKNEWLIKAFASFQDSDYFYLVMEYAPGGDLRNLINTFGSFREDDARFYFSEMLQAVSCLHELHYIHRDLKPDNFLIDREGHVKLADFGLSKGGLETQYRSTLHFKNNMPPPLLSNSQKKKAQLSKRRISEAIDKRKNLNPSLAYSVVGSPDYMAFELLQGEGYDFSVDFWSLGVILFEMVCGLPPFFGETPQQVFDNIEHYERSIRELCETLAEDDIVIEESCFDLIHNLLQPPEKRIGRHGPDEIKKHFFFNDLDWENLRGQTPFFVPNLQGDVDYKYFDEATEIEEATRSEELIVPKVSKKNLYHFTWKQPISFKDVETSPVNRRDDPLLELNPPPPNFNPKKTDKQESKN